VLNDPHNNEEQDQRNYSDKQLDLAAIGECHELTYCMVLQLAGAAVADGGSESHDSCVLNCAVSRL